MYAMELSGAHLGKPLKITYHKRNKDGSVRKNAKKHEWFLILRYVKHGTIEYAGFVSDEMFDKAPADWAKSSTAVIRSWVFKGWNVYNRATSNRIVELPYYAEVEIVSE
jgi:hypothetical protein